MPGVNDAVVLLKFMFLRHSSGQALIRGGLLNHAMLEFGGKTRLGLRENKPRHASELSTDMRYKPDSSHKLCTAAGEVIRSLKLGRKPALSAAEGSAEAIVAERQV